MAFPALAILIFIFLAGFSLGSVATAIAYSRPRAGAQSQDSPPQIRDSSNPYEPTTATVMANGATGGCALKLGIILIIAISMIAVAATIFFAFYLTLKSAPPLPPPPTVVQPQQPPTTVPTPPSN